MTLSQLWLHVGHRAGAVLVTAVLGVLVWRALRWPEARAAARSQALLLILLLLAQLTLGVLTVLMRKPADIASLHVAVGALVLVTTFALAARVWKATVPQLASAEGFQVGVPAAPGDLVPGARRGLSDRQNGELRNDPSPLAFPH